MHNALRCLHTEQHPRHVHHKPILISFTRMCFVFVGLDQSIDYNLIFYPLGMLQLCATPLWVGIYFNGSISHRGHII
jgi:hypothetical protein